MGHAKRSYKLIIQLNLLCVCTYIFAMIITTIIHIKKSRVPHNTVEEPNLHMRRSVIVLFLLKNTNKKLSMAFFNNVKKRFTCDMESFCCFSIKESSNEVKS